MDTINLNQQIKPAYTLLRLTFGIVHVVAGLDKFTDLLTHWENYLNPAFAVQHLPHVLYHLSVRYCIFYLLFMFY